MKIKRMDFEKRKKNLEDFVIFIENELKGSISDYIQKGKQYGLKDEKDEQ